MSRLLDFENTPGMRRGENGKRGKDNKVTVDDGFPTNDDGFVILPEYKYPPDWYDPDYPCPDDIWPK